MNRLDSDGFYFSVGPACNNCKHFHPDEPGASCAAFERIPREILICENDHHKPVRGDNGIQWEPSDG